MKNERKKPIQNLQGSQLEWAEPEPWPEPVDGSRLLDDIAATFKRYVVLPQGAAEALALWTLYTWGFNAFGVSPILAVTSPAKRCGKTTVVALLQSITRRSLAASSVTPAALFRLVEREAPTLIVDEADRFLLKREELTGILNSGHTKAAARVIRTVGDDFEPRTFSTWCPKAIAMIGKLDDTLQDRAIEIRMSRKTNGDRTETLRVDRLAREVEDLRRQAVRWIQDNLTGISDADPTVPRGLNSRAQDNWRPLLAIADAAGGDWPEKALQASRILSDHIEADEDPGLLLLSDIRQAFGCRDRMTTAALVMHLRSNVEGPWSEWWPDEAPRQIAKLLRPFGIRSRKIRIGSDTAQGYVAEDLADAFGRYLPSKAEQPEQAERTLSESADEFDESLAAETESVGASEAI